MLVLDSLFGSEVMVVDGSTLVESVPVFSLVVVVTAVVKVSVADGGEVVKLLLLNVEFEVADALV